MPTVYHLSHIDLDGYSCQYLSLQCFSDIHCYNANYGPEVQARLEEILAQIKASIHAQPPLILITDLNLTNKEASWIEKQAASVGAGLQLLDHHATGQGAADKHDWYFLDTKRCATRITYEWLKEKYDFDKNSEEATLVQAINAIDIWQSEDVLFEVGKVMLGMISSAREVSRIVFADEDRAFKLYLIKRAKAYVDKTDGHILLDDDLHQIRKAYFLETQNNTYDNLVASYITNEVSQQKERLTITYKGYKGILVYLFGRASVVGNAIMVDNADYDFYMDINMRGGFSLRSNNKCDVSAMAANIGNGGGHPNASGGKVEGFRESFVYENIKTFVQEHIESKS